MGRKVQACRVPERWGSKIFCRLPKSLVLLKWSMRQWVAKYLVLFDLLATYYLGIRYLYRVPVSGTCIRYQVQYLTLDTPCLSPKLTSFRSAKKVGGFLLSPSLASSHFHLFFPWFLFISTGLTMARTSSSLTSLAMCFYWVGSLTQSGREYLLQAMTDSQD